MHDIISLLDIFEQAKDDNESAPLNGYEYVGYIVSGVKITKDINNRVHIFNTHVGGDYYREIDAGMYSYFLSHGWKLGVIHITLLNYNNKLSVNKNRIEADEASNNSKYLNELLSYREYLECKRNIIIKKQSNLIQSNGQQLSLSDFK